MKVIAIKPAFYNNALVNRGDVVEVPDNFKATWFAKMETVAAKAAAKPVKQDRPAPKALSQVGKGEDKSFIQVYEKNDLA